MVYNFFTTNILSHGEDDQFVTNGWRAFGVTAQGADIAEVCWQTYFIMEEVLFKGKHFRLDFAVKVLHR